MTIAVGKFTKDENDLFDIMDDWLRRDRFKTHKGSNHISARDQSTRFKTEKLNDDFPFSSGVEV